MYDRMVGVQRELVYIDVVRVCIFLYVRMCLHVRVCIYACVCMHV